MDPELFELRLRLMRLKSDIPNLFKDYTFDDFDNLNIDELKLMYTDVMKLYHNQNDEIERISTLYVGLSILEDYGSKLDISKISKSIEQPTSIQLMMLQYKYASKLLKQGFDFI